jgi:hypothetical protein
MSEARPARVQLPDKAEEMLYRTNTQQDRKPLRQNLSFESMFSFRAKDKDKRTGIDGRRDTKKKQDEIEINRIAGSWRSGAGEGERLLLLHQTRRSGAFKGHDGSCIFTTLYYVMFRV